jgi:hypothetical protein
MQTEHTPGSRRQIASRSSTSSTSTARPRQSSPRALRSACAPYSRHTRVAQCPARLGGPAVLPRWPLAARAQQAALPAIGIPDLRSPDGMGYVEGDNVTIVYRGAEHQLDGVPELAAALYCCGALASISAVHGRADLKADGALLCVGCRVRRGKAGGYAGGKNELHAGIGYSCLEIASPQYSLATKPTSNLKTA